MLTKQELLETYELFNGDDIDALVGEFADNAAYHQMNTGHTATGRAEIKQVMEGWQTFFPGAKIGDFKIDLADENTLRKHSGAVQCFEVSFVGRGRYEVTVPGLELVAPATGQDVVLPLTETVWLDANDKIVRVTNTLDIDALK